MKKDKRIIKITILLTLGFILITIIISFHLLDTISELIGLYNKSMRFVNSTYNTTYSEINVGFFGEQTDASLLIDIVLCIIFFLIGVIVFFGIYWVITGNRESD